MIVRTEDGAQRELFGAFDSSTPIPRPSQSGSTISHSGERISLETAVSLPAFLRGVRLISETAAGLPMGLFRGFGEDRKPARNAPQAAILRRPNPDSSPFAVWSYIFVSLLRGNGYLWKLKPGGTVKYLYPVNPDFVIPRYEGDKATFDLRDRKYGPVVRTVGRGEIIHIPGILLNDPYVGVSVVEAHRNGLGTDLGRQRFEGRYLANDGAPGVVLSHPGNPTREQRQELRSGYESRHAGTSNAGKVGMIWGGWELDKVSATLRLDEAQFIESKKFSVQDIGRMLGVPAGLLGDPDAPGGDSPEQENMRFLQHGLAPWMTRVEQGLACDPDLFPEPDWSVEYDDQGFLRADIQTRWNAYRLGRQGGWITANEIRALEGRDAMDGGDEIQQTPVGGAANTSNGGNDGASANQ